MELLVCHSKTDQIRSDGIDSSLIHLTTVIIVVLFVIRFHVLITFAIRYHAAIALIFAL